MTCYSPVQAWKAKTVNSSGKRSLVFDASKGLKDLPVTIPCGGCIGCRLERSRQWATRLMHEAKLHDQKSFLTLTYDDEHLPARGQLVKADHQNFMKRLRFEHGGKLRFFMCGEYGDQNDRPHYHYILYGCDFNDRKKLSKTENGDQMWKSETLNRIWGKGHTFIGNVTPESCGYVARYVLKKVTGPSAEKHYQRIDPVTLSTYQKNPEFICMSNRPGIGFHHFEKYKSEIFASDSCVVKGKETGVPAYYTRLLDKENPKLVKKLKQKRKTRALKDKSNNTPERLAVRQECKQSKLKQLKRNL